MSESTQTVEAAASARESLLHELQDLTEAECAALAGILQKAKYLNGERAPMDELAIVREPLKARRSVGLEGIKAAGVQPAPPVIKEYPKSEQIPLPPDLLPVDGPLGKVLETRASRHDYSQEPISLRELATLLHYSYGVRNRILAYNTKGFPMRFAPSSGGLQAVEVYVLAHNITGVERGLYHYHAGKPALEALEHGFMRHRLVQGTLLQEWMRNAPLILALTCDLSKVTWKYGLRGYRVTHVDAGVVAENFHLVSNALGLSSCIVAGYADDEINELLNVDGVTEFSTLLISIGRPIRRS
jgi:SagB-type dehydrogenase family enzyme